VARIRATAPNLPILARARYVHEVEPLEEVGATSVVAEEYEGSIALVREALAHFEYHVGAIRTFSDALRDEDYEVIRSTPGLELDPWLIDLLREEEHEWITVPQRFASGLSLAQLDVRARTGVSIVAVDRGGAIDAVPSPAFAPRAGDRLLVLGTSEGLSSLEGLFQSQSRLHA